MPADPPPNYIVEQLPSVPVNPPTQFDMLPMVLHHYKFSIFLTFINVIYDSDDNFKV